MTPLLVLGLTASAAAAEPPRIVSINLCTDQLLMAVANAEQIAALSPFSVDARLSYMADEAQAFRHDAATAEQVIELDPDLVVAGRFTRRATREMLIRLGYRVELFDTARSVDESIEQIRRMGELAGRPARADDLVVEIEETRAAARETGGDRLSTAVYQRRGYMTGGETLTHELLTITGFEHAGGDLAGRHGSFVNLEQLIANPPDVLTVASEAPVAEDQGSALLSHPVLARKYPPEKRIILPERLTVCAGPSLPDAIRWLAAEADRIAGG